MSEAARTNYFTPSDFDPFRIDWNFEHPILPSENDKFSIDPNHPSFVIRREDFFDDQPVYDPNKGIWRHPRFEEYRAPTLQDVAEQCVIAEVEIQKLQSYGINIPRRSRYIVQNALYGRLDFNAPTAYMYVKRLGGRRVDPTDKMQADHILPYCRASLGYLGDKSAGEVYLSDGVYARNHTFGWQHGGRKSAAPHIYQHDLDPWLTVVERSLVTEGMINLQGDKPSASHYLHAIGDVATTLANFLPQTDDQEVEHDALVNMAKDLSYTM